MEYLRGSKNEIILLVFILVSWCIAKLRFKDKSSFGFDLLYTFLIFGLLAYTISKWSLFNYPPILEYIDTIKILVEVLVLILLLLLLLYVIIGFFSKRYSLRIDNFNVGGINIFFDQSSEIYRKTVGAFIGSKRSLFNFDKEIDNISEVLDAYHETYKYIKDNIELLDPDKDELLHKLSTEILYKLNIFLANHQNDYRRWFENITRENIIHISNGEQVIVHKTTIEDVQKHYYRYDKFLEDIKKLNSYFCREEVMKEFEIKHFNWREK